MVEENVEYLEAGKSIKHCANQGKFLAPDEFADIYVRSQGGDAVVAGNSVVKAPDKEPVPYGILGVEVMDLDDAKEMLWSKGIYAETGMGCTGPVVLVSDANGAKAEEALKEAGFRA